MKTFDGLSPNQQAKAVNAALTKLLEQIGQGLITFNDKLNGGDLQARIEKACNKAAQMGTPWFFHEYILDACREDLTGIAKETASRAFYREPGELVLDLV